MKHRCNPFGNKTSGDGVDVTSIELATTLLGFWTDATQDDILQASELQAFSAVGIASINTSSTLNGMPLGDGNSEVLAGIIFTDSSQIALWSPLVLPQMPPMLGQARAIVSLVQVDTPELETAFEINGLQVPQKFGNPSFGNVLIFK